jgi:hypothetical protein
MNIKSIFDFMKEITVKKSKWDTFSDEEKELFNPFMINKLVSMNEEYIHVANLAQAIPHTEKEQVYKFYCEFLPKKSIYSKFIKKDKSKPNQELIQSISSFYNCSFGEAEDYIYLLRKEGITELLQKVGKDEKTIKKILKEIKI